MRVSIRIFTFAFCLGAFTSTAHRPAVAQQTGTSDDTRAAIAAELAEVQGLDRLQQYWRLSLREPGEALAPIRQQMRQVDVDSAWRKAVDRAFEGSGMTGDLARQQAAALSEPEAREVIAFRRTSIGRKVTDAEVTSPVPDDKIADTAFLMAEIEKSRRALGKNKARGKAIADILAAAGGGAIQAELMMTLSRGFAVGMALAAPDGQGRMAVDDIIALVDKDRPKYLALMRTIAVPTLAMAYRQLSMAELQTYLKHLRSPTGAKNIAAITKALAAGMNKVSIAIGTSFAKDISAQRL